MRYVIIIIIIIIIAADRFQLGNRFPVYS